MGDQVMPRYFFHLSFGQRFVPDEEGVDLPSRTAARDEARAVVRDLADPEIGGNPRRWASWFLDVADGEGAFFRTPIGHPALEVVSPDGDRLRPEAPELEPVPSVATASWSREAASGRTTELVRQIEASRERTAQLLRDNQQLRRELLSVCLASEGMRVRTDRLVAIARGGRQNRY
jgi:hypothetical protein